LKALEWPSFGVESATLAESGAFLILGAVAESVPANKTILLLTEDSVLRGGVAGILTESGFRVVATSSTAEALDILDTRRIDAAVAGIESLASVLLERAASIPLLVLASAASIPAAVQALREGAEDYLVVPADPFELRARLGRILERHDLDSRIAVLQGELVRSHGLKPVVRNSTAMQRMAERMLRVAPMRTTVLVSGESGVGKELVARGIHFESPRRDFPFIAINCAAIPPGLIESELFGHEKGSFTGAHVRTRGKFEIAHRGTLFLDEIGETDPPTQAKLLRVIEEKEFMRVGGDQSVKVDVRVIAATNADLEEMVARGSFRRDLYYRLKVVAIHVPPLRERREDIASLVETFLDELARVNAVRRKTIAPEALAALERYHWPGNVRELKNVLESVLVSSPGERIGIDDLPASVLRERGTPERAELGVGTTLREMERELIRRTLVSTGGNRTHSAAVLGIGVRTLQRKIREYELEIPSKRRRPRRARSLSER
jgi:DNA-binding NtrC family response regulator